MKRSQADLSIIAARASSSPARTSSSSIYLGALTKCEPIGFTGTRRHGNKRSGKGGSSTGGTAGMWRTVSPSYRDTATHDPAQSQTLGNRNV